MKRKQFAYSGYNDYNHKYSKAIIPVGPPLKKRVDLVKMQKKLNSLSNSVEQKQINIIYAAANVPTTGSMVATTFCMFAQGITSSTRIGQKIKWIKFKVTFVYTLEQQNTFSWDICRTIMYLDKQPNGAVPPTTVLLTTNTTYLSSLYLQNKKRIKILADNFNLVNAQTGTGAVTFYPCTVYRTIEFKCAITTMFQGSTGIIGDVLTNNIGFYHISANGAVDVSAYAAGWFVDE